MGPPGGRTWLTLTFIFCHIHLLLVQAYHPTHVKHNTIAAGRRDLSGSALASASWIWTSAPTQGNVAFLRTFDSAAGKTASSAQITMTVVNQVTLWVNGQPIGASGQGPDDWQSALVFSAALNSSTNTFAVLAVNNANAGSPSPGLLASIQVTYSDGSADVVSSDSNWMVSPAIPSDFPAAANAASFVRATAATSGPWGSISIAAAEPNVPSLSSSNWIWSTSAAITDAPVGTVGFRKTVATPSGKTAKTAIIAVTVDNGFNLYVNKAYVGSSPGVPKIPDFGRAQIFTVGLNPDSNTFTIFGENIPSPPATDAGPAGVIAAINIVYSDGSSDAVTTDATWLNGAFTTVPAFLSTADSALSPSFALGLMGVSPWGQLKGFSNALAAANVPSGPFASGTLPQSTSSGGKSTSGSPSTSASATSASGVSTPGPSYISSNPGALDTGTSSPDATASPSSSSSATPTPSSNVSIGLIVGAVIGALTMIVLVALFLWRRKHKSARLHAEALSSQMYLGEEPHLAETPSTATSRRTSMASVRRAELPSIQSPQAVIYGYPRSPAMAKGFPTPPATAQAGPSYSYPYSPQHSHQAGMSQLPYNAGMSHLSYNQATRMSEMSYTPRREPLVVHNHSDDASISDRDPPAVPSKLDRENLIWQRNVAGPSSSAHMSVNYASTVSGSQSDGGSSRPSSAAYGGLEASSPGPDGELPPPATMPTGYDQRFR
ncbi:hypothetical protein FB45DRAFT_472377 [Roridomyces roridus]|uniref:Uncharacterized protein n=1 Tax=Roridomyces roridus TaxID=1738132 RepID=A0AAD7BZ40_9AGAR|nr:hypothetical protein FB45DRAFT_472377 [Roridomyces roridus]